MGESVSNVASQTMTIPKQNQSEKENVFYKGEGELLVRTTKHHGMGRKAASFIVGAGIGYVI
ncbi:MAG: hypothetical protein ACKOCQ_05705, partial [Candidatus Nitrosotenuis sp.]